MILPISHSRDIWENCWSSIVPEVVYFDALPQRQGRQAQVELEWPVDCDNFWTVESSKSPVVYFESIKSPVVYFDALPQRKRRRANVKIEWPIDHNNFWALGSESQGCRFSSKHTGKCDLCSHCDIDWTHQFALVQAHDLVVASGVHNYLGARIVVPSRLKIEEWANHLIGFSDWQMVEFLQFGWPIGFEQDVFCVGSRFNHKGAKEFSCELESYLHKEVECRHVLGPFKTDPFQGNLVISPLNTVPKRDSDERRVILDLSFPRGHSVNDGIPKDSYLGVPGRLHFPTVDALFVRRVNE